MNKINLTGSFSQTGYGLATKHITKALVKLGADVTIFPIGQLSADSQDEADLLKSLKAKQENFDSDAISLRIYHQFDLCHHTTNRTVGWPIFELDKFSLQEKRHIGANQRIIVCSGWAKGVVEEQTGHKDVSVVPLGVDPEIFYPKNRPSIHNILCHDPSTFVILNVGKWTKNKGHDALIEIFKRAFSTRDNVELWMIPHNQFLTPQETQNWHDLYLSLQTIPFGEK